VRCIERPYIKIFHAIGPVHEIEWGALAQRHGEQPAFVQLSPAGISFKELGVVYSGDLGESSQIILVELRH
jgi:hypothetical protein